jgi:predicted CXXCH cytochrome family protein
LVVLIVIAGAGGTAYAIQLENQEGFCASCHTQPETLYFQQSLENNSQNLAAFHSTKQVRCIDCHSGGGPLGRGVGLMQGAQDLMAYESGHFHSPAVSLNTLSDDSCTKCHADVVSQQTFNNHFHYFLTRWQAVDPKAAHCVDCHSAHPTGADPQQQFLTAAPVQQVCQDCHNAIRE